MAVDHSSLQRESRFTLSLAEMAQIAYALGDQGWRIPRAPHPQTVAGLSRAPVRKWNQIPQSLFQTLANSMLQRCQAYLAANSGHTRF